MKPNNFTFIDLFAGIGGFHVALARLGGKCVYASEWDSDARKTYMANFMETSPDLFNDNLFRGDITLPENQECIPENADILCAGFPCQPFSQAGLKKGFSEDRGTLFFEIARIIKTKKPKSIFLENVKNLMNHDNGKTFGAIRTILEHDLNYKIFYKIVKASDYGLPTNRPRLFIVGFRSDIKNKKEFSFPSPIPLKFTLSDVFEGACLKDVGYTIRVGGRGSGINDRRNWDAYMVDGEIRKIGLKEAKKIMGIPQSFIFPVSESKALKQLGNSVAVDAVAMTGVSILHTLIGRKDKHETDT